MSNVRILPTRTHRLGGQRVEVGTPVAVPEADAALAVRMGWATPVAAPDKAEKKPEKRAAKDES